MDIGPESHELVEHAAEMAHEHHKAAHDPDAERFSVRCAIMAACLAVLAAITALVAGHAEASAILLQSKASDQWALYQAKSLKGHMYDMSGEIVTALAGSGEKQDVERVQKALDKFAAAGKKYDKDKDDTSKDARALETESAVEFKRHVNLAMGVSSFQVGIVLVSVAMLVKKNALLWGSLGCGGLGLIFSVLGLLY